MSKENIFKWQGLIIENIGGFDTLVRLMMKANDMKAGRDLLGKYVECVGKGIALKNMAFLESYNEIKGLCKFLGIKE